MSLFACQQGYHAPSADTTKQNTGCACYERTVSEGSAANYRAGVKTGKDQTAEEIIDEAIILISLLIMRPGIDEDVLVRANVWLRDLYLAREYR